MHGPNDFLKALTTVLCVAAVTTVVFQRLRQPVVLGYILAGLIIGPHLPIPLVADSVTVQTLSELGVVLLMFSLGLEFSIRKLIRVGPTAGVTALVQCSVMIWLGFMTGRLFGWTPRESFFAGAIVAISSTTIIAKAFEEQGIKGKLREIVVGILVVEDLIAILLMASLTAISSGSGMSARALALTTGRLVAFLVGLVGIGLLVIPRAVRAVNRLNRPETTVVASVAVCFGIASLAEHFGYSVALGAFIAGSLVAESGEEKRIEHLVQPVRDIFAAVFFVSVGMLIDPALVARHWLAIVVLTLVVVLGKILSVSLGAFLTGHGVRTSVRAGMSLAQIGEFSFIIAGLGLSLGATGDFLYPVAVAVSALTTLFTPFLIRASIPVAAWVDRKLPKPLQTFAALYGTWVEGLRAGPPKDRLFAVRRLIRLLMIDAAVLAAILAGGSVSLPRTAAWVAEKVGATPENARLVVIAALIVLSAPFGAGIVRVARKLGVLLAEIALPQQDDSKLDLAAAPRRALVVTLQLGVLLLVGIPLLAITQPFVPGVPGAVVLALLLGVLGVAFWRSATNLQGHVRAGAQIIVEALAKQAGGQTGAPPPDALEPLHGLLPGLGSPTPVQLERGSSAVGKSLAELNLRGLTGATVLAITHGEESVLIPNAKERLREGDVLALAGTREAILAARILLNAQPRGKKSIRPGQP